MKAKRKHVDINDGILVQRVPLGPETPKERAARKPNPARGIFDDPLREYRVVTEKILADFFKITPPFTQEEIKLRMQPYHLTLSVSGARTPLGKRRVLKPRIQKACNLFAAIGQCQKFIDERNAGAAILAALSVGALGQWLHVDAESPVLKAARNSRAGIRYLAQKARYSETQWRDLASEAKRLFDESPPYSSLPVKVRYVAKHARIAPDDIKTGIKVDAARYRLRLAKVIPPAKSRKSRKPRRK